MLKRLPYLFFSLCFCVVSIASTANSSPVLSAQAPDIRTDQTGTSEAKARPSKAFYNDREHGWYWYEKEPALKKEKKLKAVTPKGPLLKQYTYRQLWDMYPDEFQALQKRMLKRAVQYPDEQNVKDYMVLQDIARRKALAFAGVMSYVAQTHPELTTQSDYPITTPGQHALSSIKMKEEGQTIRNNRDHFALIMFSRQGCDFCDAQKSILKFFIDKYAWPVRYIDIGQNPNMAARFNVRITPTVILVEKQSGKYMMVSAGVISMSELSLKIYRTIRYMQKDITPQQWFMRDFERNKGNDALKYIKSGN